MFLQNFTLDAEGATLKQRDERRDVNGNLIVREKFDNGFTWIRTETPTGFQRMDFSHELFKNPNGSYRVDFKTPKTDFHDYY